MEKAGNYKEYDNNFVLNETHVRKIHQILEKYACKLEEDAYVTVYISRENDSFYETDDIEKILSDENAKGKEIKQLSLEIIKSQKEGEDAESEKDRTVALIVFSKDKDTKIKFFTSYSSRDWCFLLIDEIDAQVQRSLQEKGLSLFKAKVLDIVLALVFLMVIVPLFGVLLGSGANYDLEATLALGLEDKVNFLIEETINGKLSSNLWIIPIISAFMFLFFFILEFKPLSKLLKISNISAFCWGDMILRFDKYDKTKTKFKWGVGVTFLVSLAASLVVHFLT